MSWPTKDPMQQRVSRQELHDLVWSEPMRGLAKRFGISDVALVKTCRQMHVPTPPQGHWNKKAAGKPTLRLKLPPRPAGLDNTVVLAGGRYARYHQHSISQEEILGPVPPEPTFDETMEDVRERLGATLPAVPMPKDSGLSPPAVAKLLKRDEEKREKQRSQSYISTWDAPRYDTPIQRRRLRLLSAIFLALAREGCRADTWGGHPYDGPQNDFVAIVGHQTIRLQALVVENVTPARGARPAVKSFARLRLAMNPGEGNQPDGQSWEDGDTTLEQQARSIVLSIMLRGEQQHRDKAARSHAWRIELKAQTIARLEKERTEAERKEREQKAALERKQIEGLLEDAASFRRARDIRAYVEEARAANAEAPEPASSRDMDAWASWALAQADRIDPVRTGAFHHRRDRTSDTEPDWVA